MGKQATPVLTLTLRVASGQSVLADRFVTLTSGGLVQTAADGNCIGVARNAAGSLEVLPVTTGGSAAVETGAAVAVGATVKADASGRAIPWVTSGARLGIALEAATGAGQFIEVRLLDNAA